MSQIETLKEAPDDADGFFDGVRGACPVRGLRAYRGSLSARNKEDTIRRLGRALNRVGVLNQPDGDLGAIVDRLAAALPDPRRGMSFAADGAIQTKVCRAVATALNAEFSPNAADASAQFIEATLDLGKACCAMGAWSQRYAAGVMDELNVVLAGFQAALQDGGARDESRAQLLMVVSQILLPCAVRKVEIARRDLAERCARIEQYAGRGSTEEASCMLALAVGSYSAAAKAAQCAHEGLELASLVMCLGHPPHDAGGP